MQATGRPEEGSSASCQPAARPGSQRAPRCDSATSMPVRARPFRAHDEADARAQRVPAGGRAGLDPRGAHPLPQQQHRRPDPCPRGAPPSKQHHCGHAHHESRGRQGPKDAAISAWPPVSTSPISTTVSHLKREGGRKPTTGGVLSDRHAGNAGPGLAVIQAKLRGGPGHACILPPASREGQESREKGEAGDMTVRAAPFCWVPCCTGRCGRSGSRGAETGQLGGRPGRCHPCRPCGPGRVQEKRRVGGERSDQGSRVGSSPVKSSSLACLGELALRQRLVLGAGQVLATSSSPRALSMLGRPRRLPCWICWWGRPALHRVLGRKGRPSLGPRSEGAL